ncbi:MAG: O-antigen ligase family protein, partial [Cyanobacteria bacterium J06631_2]
FSRGAIVCWFMVVGFLLFRSAIPRYQFPLLGIFFVTIIIILSTQLRNLAYLQNAEGGKLLRDDTLARIEFILDPTAQRDDSKASRLTHLEDAWQKFANRPFVGNGLGAGENDATVSLTGIAQRSHNTYLDFMVEFGFLGAFIFPAILLASVYDAEGEFRKQAIAFVLLFMTHGLFSHTLMSEFCSLVAYAMMANLARHSGAKAPEPVLQPNNFLY